VSPLSPAGFGFRLPFLVGGRLAVDALPFGGLPAMHLPQAIGILAVALVPANRMRDLTTPLSQTGPRA